MLCVLWNAQSFAQAFFVQNEGQWSGDFNTKLELKQGAMFFNEEGYRVVLLDKGHNHDHGHHHAPEKALAYQVEFVNALSENWQVQGLELYPRNYFLGKDPKNWRAGVQSYSQAQRENLYPGIDLLFYEQNEKLKYDIQLDAQANLKDLKIVYHGVKSLRLREGMLIIETEFGEIRESIPYSYQLINGRKKSVQVNYQLEGDTLSFEADSYRPGYPLLIDPILEFATFSGSGDLNFGNSATYGDNGSMYGAGVNFGINYPTTVGVFQAKFASDSIFNVDVSISKFSSDGTQLLYATYLGGNDIDVVHSLISDAAGNLIVLGNTGSDDFPTTSGAYQRTFGGGNYLSSFAFNDYNNGSDIFIAKINANGSQLMASTYWGGSGNDGINEDIYYNYGDRYRGEVVLTEDGRIAVLSNTKSTNVPLKGANSANRNQNSQDALIGVFNDQLSTLNWGRYYGDLQAESGYSLRVYENSLYITGATESSNLAVHNQAYRGQIQGNIDGYVASFDLNNGNFQAATYYGTPQRDQSFMLDIDYNGDIYIAGQTRGNINASQGVYSNPNSKQFIAKLNPSLSSLEWQTVVGSGQNKQDLVPSAFMVDQCLNIYFSGWNGASNVVGFPGTQNGNTAALPITQDAFQSTTDSSDFYFMILDHNAQSLLTASYLGGQDNEHVDGGTSRFNKDGTIYQAVCSNCTNQSFPTTPGAYAPSAGGPSCNMAVFKFSFNQILHANAEISFTTGVDSICEGLIVNLNNQSSNATNFIWDFGNGETSSDINPSVTYDQLGTYQIRLIAFDTICNISDTSFLEIEHNAMREPIPDFLVNYTSCDAKKKAEFRNLSITANRFYWDFGDGSTSDDFNPVHSYQDFGTYQVRLIAEDSVCFQSDTLYQTIEFRDTASAPDIKVEISNCTNGELEIQNTGASPSLKYTWAVEDQVFYGENPAIRFYQPGLKSINLSIEDTICNKSYEQNFSIEIEDIRNEIYTPNAFTPNGDGLNDKFEIYGDPCDPNANLKIYNRWGVLVFETDQPYQEFWDGTYQGQSAQSGVYTYIIMDAEEKVNGFFTLIR